MKRDLLITSSGAKVEFHSKIDPKTFKKVGQHFTGLIQIEVISSGDFSGLTVEKLETMINNYFSANRTISLYDFIKNAN